MSFIERSGVPVMPVTAVVWASNSSTCPKEFSMINITEDGAAANFTRSFVKAGYYLCYSKDLSAGLVVSDVRVISDKEAIPHGYCYIPEHLEPKASVWKKKRVCVLFVPVGSVDTAVLDIKLTAKSKMMLQHYTCVGDIHGFVVWCKKGQFSAPMPLAKPRSLSLQLRKLSLEMPPPPLRPSNPPPLHPGKLSQRRSNLQVNDTVDCVDSSNIYGITAIDGVPFSLHPKYAVQTNGTTPQLNTTHLSNIRIKSVQDIENEYNYTFAVEESAAKRTRPSVPTGDAS